MSKPNKTESKSTERIDPHVLAFAYLTKCAGGPGDTLTRRFYQGQFWRWDGSRYHVVSKHQFRAEVTQEMHELAGDPDKFPPFKVTSALVTNVIQALSGLTLVPEHLDLPIWVERRTYTNPNLLSMANGVVDLDALLKGEPITVLKPNPKWFSEVSLPYAFDPDAQCPQWLAFLNEVLEGDEERISLLQEWFGYCLTVNTKEQKFLLLIGEGRNGKGVVCLILTFFLGEENVSNVPLEVFGDRFQLAMTIGKLANIATEVDDLARTAEATLKQYTGGDRMYFDRKNLSGVNVHPTARLIISANNPPKFSDRSKGVWRRMDLVPFNVEIPLERMDRDLVDKLKTELPGILNWAVKGEQRLRANRGFTESRVVSAALQDYQREANPAKVFLADHVEVDPNGTVLCLDLYRAYTGWCEEKGNRPLTDTDLGKEIRRHFGAAVTKKRRSDGRRPYYYQGIRTPFFDAEPESAKDVDFLAGMGVKG
jgi:putative DNA primase/helicase